jgi:hypothetical protein
MSAVLDLDRRYPTRGTRVTTDRSATILALCEQLRRTAALTIDDDGHITDPDLVMYHIRRHVEALADELEGLGRRWDSVLDDADGLVVCERGEGIDLASWLEAHGGSPFRNRLP